MIVPYQKTGDEHLMAKNLSKYFRVNFAVKRRPPDHEMLSNISFKVFKVKNVPPFRNDADKETELTAQAVETADLFGGTCNIAHRGEVLHVGGVVGERVLPRGGLLLAISSLR